MVCSARKTFLKIRHGITPERYEEMRAAQDDRCAICRRSGRRLVIDHNHATNQIRALLCNTCNSALGAFGESQETLARAAEYLRRYETQP